MSFAVHEIQRHVHDILKRSAMYPKGRLKMLEDQPDLLFRCLAELVRDGVASDDTTEDEKVRTERRRTAIPSSNRASRAPWPRRAIRTRGPP